MIIAAILSLWRPGDVVETCINAALNERTIDEVHVWGYDPTGFAVVHELKTTLYHKALDTHGVLSTPDFLSSGNKFAGKDDWKRRHWRSKLTLDMWQILYEARKIFPDSTIVYLENDAILKPGRIATAVGMTKGINALSCYKSGGSKLYSGAGTLCFVFPPPVDPSGHLLAYHLVQPADWIMGDFSKGIWPALDCVSHGIPGKPHKSTLLLS